MRRTPPTYRQEPAITLDPDDEPQRDSNSPISPRPAAAGLCARVGLIAELIGRTARVREEVKSAPPADLDVSSPRSGPRRKRAPSMARRKLVCINYYLLGRCGTPCAPFPRLPFYLPRRASCGRGPLRCHQAFTLAPLSRNVSQCSCFSKNVLRVLLWGSAGVAKSAARYRVLHRGRGSFEGRCVIGGFFGWKIAQP